MQQRLGQWRMAGPVDLLLALPTMDMSTSQLHQCLTTAAQQLRGLLPTGSTIDVGCRQYREDTPAHLNTIRAAERALATAAAQHMPGVVVRSARLYTLTREDLARKASWATKRSDLWREPARAPLLYELLQLPRAKQSEICPRGPGFKIFSVRCHSCVVLSTEWGIAWT